MSFCAFLWCFCASKNVINSGILVTKPNKIPITISGTLNLLQSVSSVFPNKSPITNRKTPTDNNIPMSFITLIFSIFF